MSDDWETPVGNAALIAKGGIPLYVVPGKRVDMSGVFEAVREGLTHEEARVRAGLSPTTEKSGNLFAQEDKK